MDASKQLACTRSFLDFVPPTRKYPSRSVTRYVESSRDFVSTTSRAFQSQQWPLAERCSCGSQPPIWLDTACRRIFVYEIHHPRYHTHAYLASKKQPPGSRRLTPCTGSRSPENHCVMAFLRQRNLNPNQKNSYYVVDMTRMQYGKAALGPLGETYFMGSVQGFEDSMQSICGHLKLVRMSQTNLPSGGNLAIIARLEECARRAFRRWQSRDSAGWCEHCGVGGPNLLRCNGCRTKRVYYCCLSHQDDGRKLHELICEKLEATK